ncbi:MAG: hypothetical protein CMI31_09660 [Opitutae bacterium]|nr:hypothetical protein [Opitutae bacterium]|tara:strand:+ start:1811 stop:2371 length:561 start_codon:yes stop_codon:yes gene_type:complete
MLENGEQIWTQIKEGDTKAFSLLYDAFGGAMFSLSMKILNDRWDAEEVVQDTLAAFWKKPDSYSPRKGKLTSWLLVLVRNRSIDRYRARKRRKDTADIEVTLETQPHDEAKDGVTAASQSDDRKLLREAFLELPEKQRVVVEYSFFKGMAHAEISAKLSISLGTVKSRIRLGLEKLRRCLPEAELH